MLLVAVMCSQPRSSLAQCIGDCDGNEQVTIDEILTLVSIALGTAAAFECEISASGAAAGGPTVDYIVRAINHALCGCGAECVASSPTPTATHSPMPTVTATTGPPDVAGTWKEDRFRVSSSSCHRDLINAVEEELGGITCTNVVQQQGAQITTSSDCGRFGNNSSEGTVDFNGVYSSMSMATQSQSGCTLMVEWVSSVDLSISPTTYTSHLDFDFTGVCGIGFDCQMTFTTRWARR